MAREVAAWRDEATVELKKREEAQNKIHRLEESNHELQGKVGRNNMTMEFLNPRLEMVSRILQELKDTMRQEDCGMP